MSNANVRKAQEQPPAQKKMLWPSDRRFFDEMYPAGKKLILMVERHYYDDEEIWKPFCHPLQSKPQVQELPSGRFPITTTVIERLDEDRGTFPVLKIAITGVEDLAVLRLFDYDAMFQSYTKVAMKECGRDEGEQHPDRGPDDDHMFKDTAESLFQGIDTTYDGLNLRFADESGNPKFFPKRYASVSLISPNEPRKQYHGILMQFIKGNKLKIITDVSVKAKKIIDAQAMIKKINWEAERIIPNLTTSDIIIYNGKSGERPVFCGFSHYWPSKHELVNQFKTEKEKDTAYKKLVCAFDNQGAIAQDLETLPSPAESLPGEGSIGQQNINTKVFNLSSHFFGSCGNKKQDVGSSLRVRKDQKEWRFVHGLKGAQLPTGSMHIGIKTIPNDKQLSAIFFRQDIHGPLQMAGDKFLCLEWEAGVNLQTIVFKYCVLLGGKRETP